MLAPMPHPMNSKHQVSDALLVPRSFHATIHNGPIKALTCGKRSRLGESNPRPTHYANSRHRIHHAHCAHSCTSNRSPCSTRMPVGRRFVPRMVPRSILSALRSPAGRPRTKTSSSSVRYARRQLPIRRTWSPRRRSAPAGVDSCPSLIKTTSRKTIGTARTWSPRSGRS
jgi:hypothetical protein